MESEAPREPMETVEPEPIIYPNLGTDLQMLGDKISDSLRGILEKRLLDHHVRRGGDGRFIDPRVAAERVVEPVRPVEPGPDLARAEAERVTEEKRKREAAVLVSTIGCYRDGDRIPNLPEEERLLIGNLLRGRGVDPNEVIERQGVEEVWRRAQEIYFGQILGDELARRIDIIDASIDADLEAFYSAIEARNGEFFPNGLVIDGETRNKFGETFWAWVEKKVKPRVAEPVAEERREPAPREEPARRLTPEQELARFSRTDLGIADSARAKALERLANNLALVEDTPDNVDLRRRVGEALALAREQARKGEKLTAEQCRARLITQIENYQRGSSQGKAVFMNEGQIGPMIRALIDKVSPEQLGSIERELLALAKMLNALRAFDHFKANSGEFVQTVAKKNGEENRQPNNTDHILDVTKREVLRDILAVEDSSDCRKTNISLVWKELAKIDKRIATLPEDQLNDFEREMKAGKLRGMEGMVRRYEWVKARLVGNIPPVTDLEMRKAEFLNQMFTAGEVDASHPLYSLMHTREVTNKARKDLKWKGSPWVFRRMVVSGEVLTNKIRDGITEKPRWDLDTIRAEIVPPNNVMPEKLVESPAEMINGLTVALGGPDGDPVEVLVGLVDRDLGAKEDDVMAGIAKMESDAAAVQVRLGELALNESEKKDWSPDMLWKTREKIMGLVAKGQLSGFEAIDLLEKMGRVYFLEASVFDDGAKKTTLEPTDKLKNPVEMWGNMVAIAGRRPEREKRETGDVEVERGFFEIGSAFAARRDQLQKEAVLEGANLVSIRTELEQLARDERVVNGQSVESLKSLGRFARDCVLSYKDDPGYATKMKVTPEQSKEYLWVMNHFPGSIGSEQVRIHEFEISQKEGVVSRIGSNTIGIDGPIARVVGGGMRNVVDKTDGSSLLGKVARWFRDG